LENRYIAFISDLTLNEDAKASTSSGEGQLEETASNRVHEGMLGLSSINAEISVPNSMNHLRVE
jgi:hypothetical protein